MISSEERAKPNDAAGISYCSLLDRKNDRVRLVELRRSCYKENGVSLLLYQWLWTAVQIVDGATLQNLLHAVLLHEGDTRLLRQEESPGAK